MKKLLSLIIFFSLATSACTTVAPVTESPATQKPAPEPAESSTKSTAPGTITGIIMLTETEPMAEGKVVVFHEKSGPPPFPSRYLRPPDETADLNKEGKFSINLPEGRYYFTAINKDANGQIGPPVEGDYVFPGPVSLQEGQTIYTITSGKTTDIGRVQAVRFSKDDLPDYDNITSITGTIFGPDGNPVAGAIAFAFTSPNVVGKPLFVAERTGADGKYELRVNEGGSYYVKTRSQLRGGHPVEGELIGVYGAGLPQKVEIKTGEHLTEIDMHARAFVNYRKDPEKAKYKPEGARE